MKKYISTFLFLGFQTMAFSQEHLDLNTNSSASGDDTLFTILVITAIVLLIPIVILLNTVLSSLLVAIEKFKSDSKKVLPVFFIVFLCFKSQEVHAAELSVAMVSWHWSILTIIIVELAVILGLAYILLKVSRNILNPNLKVDENVLPKEEVRAIEEAKLVLEHEYDGIRELDNDLPPWWKYLFYATIIFGAFYMYYYSFSGFGMSQDKEYETAMQTANLEKIKFYANSPDMQINAQNAKVLTESNDIETGKSLFAANCSACHAVDGGGMVGPNLTDMYWLHGGSTSDIFKVISEGVLDKGMPSWKQQLNPKQIEQVMSFIKYLQGSKPAAPKEAQGEIYQENDALKEVKDSTLVATNS